MCRDEDKVISWTGGGALLGVYFLFTLSNITNLSIYYCVFLTDILFERELDLSSGCSEPPFRHAPPWGRRSVHQSTCHHQTPYHRHPSD